MKMHKLPKVKRKFCNVCKLSWTVSEMDFLEHRKKCSKDDAKAALEKTIECQKCGKICKNIKAYTVHQMFHKQDPTYPKTAEQLKNSKAGVFICETCGESHKTRNQLRQHIRRKHEIAETYVTIASSIDSQRLFLIVRNPDGTEKTVCEFCGRECVSSYRLMLHKKKMHDVGRKSK